MLFKDTDNTTIPDINSVGSMNFCKPMLALSDDILLTHNRIESMSIFDDELIITLQITTSTLCCTDKQSSMIMSVKKVLNFVNKSSLWA